MLFRFSCIITNFLSSISDSPLHFISFLTVYPVLSCRPCILFHFCAMKSLRLCTEFKTVIGRNFVSGHMLVSFQSIDRFYFYQHIHLFFPHIFLSSEIIRYIEGVFHFRFGSANLPNVLSISSFFC